MKTENLIMISEGNILELFKLLLAHFEKQEGKENQEIWIDTEATKKMLSIKSDTTLFKLRSEGKIEFSQPSRKIILYKKTSILKYLEDNSYKTF
ncbi:DNA-binding protein [Tenacibaculum sp. 190524A02b]|uniref:DNA-binding protein n=1 Tax=Tenacibaculum vairaonense TaxID=3137860 RepID=A0ABM9PIS1_9FLAO